MNLIVLKLCIKVFCVRILDVSLGTLRTIVTVKGQKFLASFIGFFEVFVWFLVVKEALNTSVTSIWIGFSYALGFATGTYIGTFLSEKLIPGNLTIQVVTSKQDKNMIRYIRNLGYGVSVIPIKGKDFKSRKYLLFIEIDKNDLTHIRKIIKNLDSKAFVVVNESKQVYNGYFEKNIEK